MTVVANAEFAQSYMAQDQVWRLWVTVPLVWVREMRQSSVKMVSRRTTTRWRVGLCSTQEPTDPAQSRVREDRPWIMMREVDLESS